MMNKLDHNDMIKISPSPIYAFIKVFPLMCLSLGIAFISAKWFPLLMLIALVFIFIAWYRYLFLRYTVYFVDEEVLKVKTGLFAKRIDSLELYRVKDYVITQSFFMRFFRVMTITLYTKDLTSETLLLTGVPVSELPDIIRGYVQKARAKNGIFEIN